MKPSSLIRCINCNTLYKTTPFDQYPEYHYTNEAKDFFETDKNDLIAFEKNHKGHNTEQLCIIENSSYSEGAYADPLRITYFEATNGKKKFLIKRWRKSIAEEFCYELVKGRLEIKSTVVVQRRDLEKQIGFEIKNPPLADEIVKQFINIVEEEASLIDPEQCADHLCETNDAHISYLPLNETSIANIVQKCRNSFAPEVSDRLSNFVLNNTEYDSVMSLMVKKQAVICPEPVPDSDEQYDKSVFDYFLAF